MVQSKEQRGELVPPPHMQIIRTERKEEMTDYSEEFDRLRRNRVELSHIKYGSARINFGGGRVDALKTAEDCLEAFKRDKIPNTSSMPRTI